MIARWIRRALFAECLAYVLLAFWLRGLGCEPSRIFAVILGTFLGLRFIVTLMPFLVVISHRRHDGRQVSVRAFMRAFAGEFVANLISFTVYQPFDAWCMGKDPDAVAGGPTPILLVHGYLCNRGSWTMMRWLLASRLPHPVHTINLEPPLGRIDDYVPQLEARVREILAASGHARLHLVCHSMGGLVARAWLQRCDGIRHTASLITLGTPHHGTVLSRFGVGRNVRQMRPDAAWLAELERTDRLQGMPCVSLHTDNDNLVYPPESADMAQATNIRIDGVGHVQLQSSARVADFIAAAIRGNADASRG